MGIRGLTTFIHSRSRLYLEDYELHDCNLVLDGNSIASNLYKWNRGYNDCFGGDYDQYVRVIIRFFDTLKQCNITPYVIFDGGYEKRKLATVIGRMKNKIQAADNLNSVSEETESVFPLFMREVFVDYILSLGIKVARCEYEADSEIACVAKALDCPVLSFDSDFYIFGSDYIPSPTLDTQQVKEKNGRKYIPCKIFKIQKFLDSYRGLDQTNLPLLAVLLGNDYVKGSLFAPFFRNLKIQKCSGNPSPQQKRIKSVIVWLQNETVESAIRKILGRFKDHRRRLVSRKIQQAMQSYFDFPSELCKFLDIIPKRVDGVDIDFAEIEHNVDEADDILEEEFDVEQLDLNDAICEGLKETLLQDEGSNPCAEIFLEKFRKCQYPPCFMDMIVHDKYYCVPQVEYSNYDHSHTVSLEILAVIHKILTSHKNTSLTVVSRNGNRHIKNLTIPRPDIKLPSLKDIHVMNLSERKNIFLNVLGIDESFFQVVDSFPTEWHVFLISLKYCAIKKLLDIPLVFSLIICFMVLNYVDASVGFIRTLNKLRHKRELLNKKNMLDTGEAKTDFDNFNNLPRQDMFFCLEKLINCFQMAFDLQSNAKHFDRILVHSMSQIQSVFLHVKYLNSLLDTPFSNFSIHTVYNGTFIYNMTKNLRSRRSPADYLEVFFEKCPVFLNGVKYVFSSVEPMLNFVVSLQKPRRKKKKRAKSDGNVVLEIVESENDENCDTIDSNNPYSVLLTL